MKLKAQVLIDADPATVWRIFNRPDVVADHVGTVTEAREPDLVMGLWEGAESSAVVVNHFEPIDDRWRAGIRVRVVEQLLKGHARGDRTDDATGVLAAGRTGRSL